MRVSAGLLAFGLGCGDGVSPPPPVATVTIQVAPPVELVPGGTQMLSVLPKDAKGNPLTDRPAIWTSSDDSKVTVAAGLISGVAIGTATITASVEGHTATVDVVVKNGAVVSATGTTFTTQNGSVTVAAPAGAVSQTTNFTVEPATNAPANPRLMPGTAFAFGPNGATFAQPVSITIKYNPANVAADSPESGLQLYEAVPGSPWRVVTGSTVNLTEKTVTGSVGHFSIYAVMMQPKVETVTIGGDLTPMPVVTTRQLTTTLKDNEGTTITRAVSWSSSDATIASVSTSGVVSSKKLGTVTITATSETRNGTASLTVIPGPPAKFIPFAGNNQSVAAGAAVPAPPSVLITDAGDNPISGVTVNFVVSGGGGTVTGSAATTNASGIAAVGSWTLGTTAGPNSLTATTPAIAGATFTFQAAGGAGPAAVVALFGGNDQTATSGGLVANSPSVKVTDANNNFVAGFAVTFAPASGSGSVTGGSVVTNAAGIATVGSWRLGTTPGPQSLNATAAGLTGSPVVINATGIAPVASTIAGFAGNNQTARPAFNVATPPSVIVTDPAGIPVPGVSVTFAVTAGGGTITGETATTNASGIAAVGSWTLGSTAGTNTLTATSGTLTGSPVTFNATGVSLPPTKIAMNAGDQQVALAGQPVPIPPSAKVTDAEGFGVPGVTVTFTIRSGGGTIQGATVTTNASGIATIGSWVLGIGGNSLFASAPGLSGDPLIFVALGQAQVQVVTFGDSNTDLGFQGTSPIKRVASYVSSSDPNIRLAPNAPNSNLQLAGKIEARWRANRNQTITIVNHGISGTSSGAGRTIVFAPNALEVVGGLTRFQGEVLGMGYPWSGGEPVNDFYPTGAIQRTNAFAPRTSDFAYISIGTNDIINGGGATSVRINLETMIDQWINRGLPANRLIVTTLPPLGSGGSAGIQALNTMIRTLAQQKGVRLVDIAAFTSSNGLTWSSSSMHVGDFIHYSEAVRDWIADQVVSIMFQLNP